MKQSFEQIPPNLQHIENELEGLIAESSIEVVNDLALIFNALINLPENCDLTNFPKIKQYHKYFDTKI
jgi:hypothetical protein